MGQEIERKFLVVGDQYKVGSVRHYIRQGYLCNEPERVVRVRIEDENGLITIKGRTVGLTRPEFEYEIPLEDAVLLLENLCPKPQIEKYRYRIEINGSMWEVDEFLGENAGLVVAEIELATEDTGYVRPAWLGDEVTFDSRYINANLVRTPYKEWGER
ncbi:MAG TPA: CYTH domain-containing protein [Bacillota bacterium]|nr:CYTH domain-containing protein [Bacillota bacterium]